MFQMGEKYLDYGKMTGPGAPILWHNSNIFPPNNKKVCFMQRKLVKRKVCFPDQKPAHEFAKLLR